MNLKSKMALVAAVMFLLPFGVGIHAFAQEVREAPDVVVPPETRPSSEKDAEMRIISVQESQAQANDTTQNTSQERLQARLNSRKERYSTQPLSATEKQRIEARCEASQGMIRSLEGKVQGIETSRQQVYTGILSKLGTLNETLRQGGLDTTELAAEIGDLEQQVNQFYELLGTYKQTVADLGAMDCTADAEAFKASITAARESLVALRTSEQTIVSKINDGIKSTFTDLRNQTNSEEQ